MSSRENTQEIRDAKCFYDTLLISDESILCETEKFDHSSQSQMSESQKDRLSAYQHIFAAKRHSTDVN